jgi:hypothetical protein
MLCTADDSALKLWTAVEKSLSGHGRVPANGWENPKSINPMQMLVPVGVKELQLDPKRLRKGGTAAVADNGSEGGEGNSNFGH